MVKRGNAHYIGDAVFGAMDGLISTLAVVAGVYGASVSNKIVLIAGASAMLAEALSMGFSSFLASRVRSRLERIKERPAKEAFLFWLATIGGGFIPLIGFLFNLVTPFRFTVILSMIFLFFIGVITSRYTRRNWLYSGLESLVIGVIAATITYYVGYLINSFV